ncbi:MAG: hypothetical protein JRJ11_17215 [Deltaproteobacteria bacterium]|nr:hypothetical protein [Deltaproteobacteria bacterium]
MTNSIKEIVEKTIEGAKTDEKKMERIFNFVHDEIFFVLHTDIITRVLKRGIEKTA